MSKYKIEKKGLILHGTQLFYGFYVSSLILSDRLNDRIIESSFYCIERGFLAMFGTLA